MYNKNMSNLIKIIVLFVLTVSFQSCLSLGIGNSEFSCPMPKTMNLKCMPPSEVYKLSNEKKLYTLESNKNISVISEKKCNCNIIYQNNNNDISLFNEDGNMPDLMPTYNDNSNCYCETLKTKNKKFSKKIRNIKVKTYKKKFYYKQDDVDFNPVLKKPKILLIWFSYWIDKDNDLHSNEYIYMKVLSRFWSIGKRNFDRNRMLLSPLVNPNLNQNTAPQELFGIQKEAK